MTRDNEIANAALEAMTETLMSCPMYEFSPKATDLLECAYIKGAEWADSHPINTWNSVADVLPPLDTIVLINTKDYGAITARYDKGWEGVEVPLFYSADCARTANEVDYWMEIPELPE